MNGILKGVRPLDYVLAGLLTVAGAALMVGNVISDPGDVPHPPSSTSWAMVPTFLLVTLPILWRRRHVLAVIGVTAVAAAVHVLAFGWLTRCGVALPVSIALAYAVARFAGPARNQVAGLAGIVVLQLLVLVRDSSIDTVGNGLLLALPLAALFYGIGLVVQNRVSARRSAVAPVVEHTAA